MLLDTFKMSNQTSTVPYRNLNDPIIDNRSPDCNLQVETNLRPLLKYHKAMRALAIVELVFAILIILLGLVAFGVSTSATTRTTTAIPLYNVDFTSFWLGILYLIACSLGVGGLQKPSGNRCPITAYFVMLIICIVFTPILMSVSIVWAVLSSDYCGDGAF